MKAKAGRGINLVATCISDEDFESRIALFQREMEKNDIDLWIGYASEGDTMHLCLSKWLNQGNMNMLR
ncbi:MAG: hypothetical protein PWP04_936 [Candidatus Atribacteria bacterium]|nr:hypothetical protein [Candidatus Atribacteria bacterium]